jgi:hypothetical protein
MIGQLVQRDGREGTVIAIAIGRVEGVGHRVERIVELLVGVVGERHLDHLERAELDVEPLAVDDHLRDLPGLDRHGTSSCHAAVAAAAIASRHDATTRR